jgi:hypothetical protein
MKFNFLNIFVFFSFFYNIKDSCKILDNNQQEEKEINLKTIDNCINQYVFEKTLVEKEVNKTVNHFGIKKNIKNFILIVVILISLVIIFLIFKYKKKEKNKKIEEPLNEENASFIREEEELYDKKNEEDDSSIIKNKEFLGSENLKGLFQKSKETKNKQEELLINKEKDLSVTENKRIKVLSYRLIISIED